MMRMTTGVIIILISLYLMHIYGLFEAVEIWASIVF